jgi:hypothetical protein
MNQVDEIMALAEAWRTAGCKEEHAIRKDHLRGAIKALLEQPVQEPAFYWDMDVLFVRPERARFLGFDVDAMQALYTTPPAQPTLVQEPESFEQWNAKQHGDPEEIGFLQALRIAYCAGQDSVTKTTPPAQPAACTWSQVDDEHTPDTWEADCGAVWTFTEGGPADNDMKFCTKCGKHVEQKDGAA